MCQVSSCLPDPRQLLRRCATSFKWAFLSEIDKTDQESLSERTAVVLHFMCRTISEEL